MSYASPTPSDLNPYHSIDQSYEGGTTAQPEGPRPHPYLSEPKLYISNLAPDVTDADLARAFETCTPVRPNIARDNTMAPVGGWIDFKFLESAEKALATLQSRPLLHPSPPSVLVLSPFPPTDPPTILPPPRAIPRLVKHLPLGTTDAFLYDLFRPYGAIASVRNQASFGPNTGVVEFWEEEDARAAEDALQYADVAGSNIAVQAYQPRRGAHADFNAAAAPFVPSGGLPSGSLGHPSPYSPSSTNTRLPPYVPNYAQQPMPPYPGSPTRGSGGPFVHGLYLPSTHPHSSYAAPNAQQVPPPPAGAFEPGPGQQVQFAPLVGPGSGSSSGLIDPCNLFCKNLDPAIDSNDLFVYFRPFGQIVSARVMRGDTGQSRGFGFVSYQTPEQATHAMHMMNGQQLGTKQVQVRLHEPKQLRQEKLAQRFSGGPPKSPGARQASGNGPAGDSGATSPAISDGGESPTATGAGRERRGSGSYYNAALAGNLTWNFEELQSLSPVVRKEVLTGELGRRVKNLNVVPPSELDSVVDSLLKLDLSDVVGGFQDPTRFSEQVRAVTESPGYTPSIASSETLNDQRGPSTSETPLAAPSTASPSRSPAPSDRDRLFAAVARLEPDSEKSTAIAELLYTLTKKERALCLFNAEYLKTKVAAAREVIEADDDEDEEDHGTPASNHSAPPAPGRGPYKMSRELSDVKPSSAPAAPQPASEPALSSTNLDSEQQSKYSAADDPASGVSGEDAVSTSAIEEQRPQYTLASLAALPAKDILKLTAPSGALKGLPLPKPDPAVVKATDDFVDGLEGKAIQQQKQLVGEKLFKVIKAFGIKGSPKITIALLDSEDLRALSHLMNSYPNVLKEKVLQQVAK